uniref:EGF-like domain-containing protein n=1 Tax=Meloidogyne hapla TaxID=6305 RepID=A0A1I8BQJ0_MELHA
MPCCDYSSSSESSESDERGIILAIGIKNKVPEKAATCFGDSGCNDHGWCLASSNSSQCICRSGWSGKYCQKKD